MKIWAQPEFSHLRHAPLRAGSGVAARAILAGVFLYAGVLKARDPSAFLLDVRSFQLLGDPWAAWLALGLPWLEILCALALLLGGWTRGALLLIGGMALTFAAAFLLAWTRGVDVTCGCFGKSDNQTNFVEALSIDLGLLALVAVAWWAWSANTPAQASPQPEGDPSPDRPPEARAR